MWGRRRRIRTGVSVYDIIRLVNLKLVCQLSISLLQPSVSQYITDSQTPANFLIKQKANINSAVWTWARVWSVHRQMHILSYCIDRWRLWHTSDKKQKVVLEHTSEGGQWPVCGTLKTKRVGNDNSCQWSWEPFLDIFKNIFEQFYSGKWLRSGGHWDFSAICV